jgi:RNA polymerase sigma-70 factor (ECF subfamily)
MSVSPADDVAKLFRREYGRAVAVLVRQFGDIDVAEDAVQDAFDAAIKRWPSTGAPPNPVGWIITTARNRAIDRHRRESRQRELNLGGDVAQEMRLEDTVEEEQGVHDDRLRLIFTCCHPALNAHAQVALTLRLIGGLTTANVARAFLVSEQTLAQRLVRAKGKIRDARIPFRIPSEAEFPERIRSVLAVVYLIFNEGYAASSGDTLVREDLCAEAIRLARLLVELMPEEPEVLGLLALLLLIDSRRESRVSAEGDLVLLADQDRSRWNRALLDEGQALVRWCLRINQPGPYQLQAAINAVHSDADSANETDWGQVLQLYDQLMAGWPSPIVALNRAIAVAEVDGCDAALRIVEDLALDSYYLFHAVRADLLRRVSRHRDAADAYNEAISRCANSTERRFLEKRRARLIRE